MSIVPTSPSPGTLVLRVDNDVHAGLDHRHPAVAAHIRRPPHAKLHRHVAAGKGPHAPHAGRRQQPTPARWPPGGRRSARRRAGAGRRTAGSCRRHRHRRSAPQARLRELDRLDRTCGGHRRSLQDSAARCHANRCSGSASGLPARLPRMNLNARTRYRNGPAKSDRSIARRPGRCCGTTSTSPSR